MNDLPANDDLTEGLIKQKAMEAFALDQLHKNSRNSRNSRNSKNDDHDGNDVTEVERTFSVKKKLKLRAPTKPENHSRTFRV